MNLLYYRNFVLATEAGNLTKAAHIAHIAQPALTHQIKVLEEEFGTKLFESGRGRHQLKLTDKGWTLYRRAKELCRLEDETIAEMTAKNGGEDAVLKFSMAAPRIPTFVSRCIEPFTRIHPHIRYDIRETYHLATLDDVLNGRSEVGITNIAIPETYHFDVMMSKKEQYFAVGMPDNPWLDLNHDVTDLDELRDVPIAFSHGHQQAIETAFLNDGIVPFLRGRVGTLATALNFARHGVAIAIVSLGEEETLPDGLVKVPIKRDDMTSNMLVIKLKGRALTRPMREFMKNFAENLQEEQ